MLSGRAQTGLTVAVRYSGVTAIEGTHSLLIGILNTDGGRIAGRDPGLTARGKINYRNLKDAKMKL